MIGFNRQSLSIVEENGTRMKNIRCFFHLVPMLAFLIGCASTPAISTVTMLPTIAPTSTIVPATATPVVTEILASKPEDISGWWWQSNSGVIFRIRFLPNATIRSGPVENPNKFLHGTYTFEGTVVHVDEPSCGPGTYEAHIIQHNEQNFKLYFKVIEDPCRDRYNEMTRGYYWVGPE